MATADEILDYLGKHLDTQRDKLATVRARYVDAIRALTDDDHLRVFRELRKRINSPKLVADRDTLLAEIARTYAPKPTVVTVPPPPVYAPRSPDQGDALAAAIAADPDRRDAYLVYADWLIEHQDPFGERIVAAARKPDKDFPDALGTLRDLVTQVTWHMGFIKRCRVAFTSERFNEKITIRIPDVIAWLLDEPGHGRFVQDLTVGMVMHDDQRYDEVCRVIARHVRPSLRRLALGDFEVEDCELNWSAIGDIAMLWPKVPELRELWLRSGSMELGAIDLPKLEKLETITGGMSETTLDHLANAAWPALRELSLQIGRGREGAATDEALVTPILAATRVPALRKLGIMNCEFTDELCALLLHAPILPQLGALDLSMGTMSDVGADVLLGHPSRFAHLDINVDDNYLSPAACAKLVETFAKKITVGGQRYGEDEGDDRHASAFE